MSRAVGLSFRTAPARAEQLDRLVEATERPRSWHLERALERYLDDEAWQAAHIQEGVAELRRGEGVDHERVAAWLRTWGTPEEDEPPR